MNSTSSTAAAIPITRCLNPVFIARNLWRHRDLIHQLSKQELLTRYRGSFMGIMWAFVTPLLMLAVYTFVFQFVLPAKWGTSAKEGTARFALNVFCGLIVYNIFADTVMRSSSLIMANANYVKKIIFPLEILPINILISNLVLGGSNLIILILGLIVFGPEPSWTMLYLPLIFLPFILLVSGLGWLLSSLGVFIRDIDHAIVVIVQLFFFMTPVFYTIDRIPEQFRWVFDINPLAVIVTNFRLVAIDHLPPDWGSLLYAALIGVAVMMLGHAWLMRSKRWFADVI